MAALYDLSSWLNQNTEGSNFSGHLQCSAMAFQVAAKTFVVRSRLREVRTMPYWSASFLRLLFLTIQSYLIALASRRFDPRVSCAEHIHPRQSCWNSVECISRQPCSNLSARLQFCKGRKEKREKKLRDQTAGKRMVKSEPTPGSLLTSTSPLWARTMALTTLKPRPRPGCDRLLSPR
jgi:hypothetical protein